MNHEATALRPATAAPPSAESDRFHSLDALRAFALLLGVLFHAAESFSPGVERYWAIADSSPSAALDVFRHASHSFRLEIFFVIAGFFARLVYHRRGPREFIRNRFNRILVPLAVGWAILYPLLASLWLWGASLTGRLGQLGIPPEYAGTPVPLLVLGMVVTMQWLKLFDWTHLWFLHQLLWVYVFALLARATWCRLPGDANRRLAWVDRQFAALCRAPWKVLALAAVTTPMLMLMDSWVVDTPKNSLLPHLSTTFLFGFQFGFGWLLHRQTALLEQVARGWGIHLLLGVVMIAPSCFGIKWLAAADVRAEGQAWVHWTYSAVYALMMWAFVLGFFGLFIRCRSKPSAGWRYVADSSYWIYIAHLPLVVWLQVIVAKWPWPWPVKYPFILLVSFPALFLSYHYLVRSTFLGAQLNGRKYPFLNPLAAFRRWRQPAQKPWAIDAGRNSC